MAELKRRTFLQTGLVLSALPWHNANACEYFSPTLRITHPWTRATPMDAPFAVLGLRFDEVTQDDRLLAVETPVAEAVVYVPGPTPEGAAGQALALPFDIPAGQDTVLADTGPHLRLLRLTQPLEVARSYPLRLVFEKGGSVKALLNVDYPRFSSFMKP